MSSPYPTVEESLGLSRRTRLLVAFAAALVIVMAALGIRTMLTPNDPTGTVQRVIDGDTIAVRLDGRTERVQLFDVDAPDLVDNGTPSPCLANEAADFTRLLLRPGDAVTLTLGAQRRASQGQILAEVVTASGRNVGVELAGAGLGVPVDSGASGPTRPTVRAAFDRASQSRLGLFDPANECTLAAKLGSPTAPSDTLAPTAGPGMLDQRLHDLETVGAAQVEALALLSDAERTDDLRVLAFRAAGRDLELERARIELAEVPCRIGTLKAVTATVILFGKTA